MQSKRILPYVGCETSLFNNIGLHLLISTVHFHQVKERFLFPQKIERIVHAENTSFSSSRPGTRAT